MSKTEFMVSEEIDYMDKKHFTVKNQSKYVWYHHNPEKDKPKTVVWDVLTKSSNVLLGEIKYYANWRQYCFFPEKECVFSIGCLNDIIKFTNALNLIQRKRKTKVKESITCDCGDR